MDIILGRILSRFFSTFKASSREALSALRSLIEASAWRSLLTIMAGSTSPVDTIGACIRSHSDHHLLSNDITICLLVMPFSLSLRVFHIFMFGDDKAVTARGVNVPCKSLVTKNYEADLRHVVEIGYWARSSWWGSGVTWRRGIWLTAPSIEREAREEALSWSLFWSLWSDSPAAARLALYPAEKMDLVSCQISVAHLPTAFVTWSSHWDIKGY